MPSSSGIYMKGPTVWPFKQPVVPANLMPSMKTYTTDANGIIYVDPRDVSVLLSYSFFLAGASSGKLSNLSDVASDVPAENDVVTFQNGLYRPKPSTGGDPAVLVESGNATKISAMSAASALAGTELVDIVQSGANKKTTTQAIADLASGSSPGFTPISGGTISSPIQYFNMTLPSGYSAFELTIAGFDFGNVGQYEILAFAVSRDSGATFINASDSYLTGYSPGTPDKLGNFTDSLTPTDYGALVRATIYPGSSVDRFCAFSSFVARKDDNLISDRPTVTCFYHGSTPLQPAGRINFLRVQPYGNGDAGTPPTSNHTLTRGFWSLSGWAVS